MNVTIHAGFMKQLPFILLFAATMHLRAMDRFASLSMVESGDRDGARGKDGEISRYQISPRAIYDLRFTIDDLKTPAGALLVARRIMEVRVARFLLSHRRHPTDIEWYLLWHRPACLSAAQQRRPTGRELERAQRFANLVNRPVVAAPHD